MAVGWWARAYGYARAVMQKMTTASEATTYFGGDVAVRMQPMTTASSGWMEPKGDVAGVMKLMTASVVGVQEVPASVAAAMKPMSSAVQVDVVDVVMTAAAVMKQMTTVSAADVSESGAVGAVMKPMTAAVSGAQSLSGTVAAAMKQMTAAAAGSQSVPPAYDSKSALGTTFGQSLTLSHTTVAASTTIYAFFAAETNVITGATCDGVAMTQVATLRSGLSTIWKATVSASGSHSVVGNTPGAGSQSGITGFSIAYTNVTTTGTAQTASSTSNGATQTVTLGSAKIILQAFFALNGGGSGASFSSPTGGTNRANGSQGQYSGLCVSDATATTTFGATGSPSFWTGYDAIALPLS